jgi:hypothetical protein
VSEQWEIRLWVPPSSVDHTWEPLPHDAWPFAVTHQGIWLRRRVTTPTHASGEQQQALTGQPAQAARERLANIGQFRALTEDERRMRDEMETQAALQRYSPRQGP